MLDFLQYEFMQRAILAGILISVLTPILGVFIVARRASLLSDTFAHTALAGVGMALLFNFNPILGAVSMALVASLGVENLIRMSKLGNDAIQAVFLSGGLALAVLLTSFQDSAKMGFESYLFGSLLSVTWMEIYMILSLLILVVVIIYFYYWEFLLISINESLAKAKGINTSRYKTVLSLLTAFLVALSLKIIGALLVGALIVLPVLTASRFAKSFKNTLIFSMFFALLFVLSGLAISYVWNVPSGSAIVLFGIFIFILSLIPFKK